jgi:viroplasmin and RNaseH domain-containing protein
MSKNNFYAVIVGRMPGIYTSYSDCNKQVSGFSGNKFKGFNTLEEATAYFNENFKKPKNKKSSKKTKSVISYSVDFLNASQLMIYNEMCKDANIFITGDAGTGKSFLINTFIAEQRKLNKNVIICAPTGVAAINIG